MIQKESDHPFFLYFSLPAPPHTPILPAKEFQGRSKTNNYGGDFVLHCNSVVGGRILSALDEAGLKEDTLVVFTSDNGCSPSADFPSLERAGHNPSYHFRGGMKADIYEGGGHRVPLLMRWPKVIEPGSTCDQLVSLCDLYATLGEYLGVELASDEAVDSYSMLATLKFPSLPTRPSLVHQSIDGSLSLRRGGPWKLEMCKGSGGWSFPPVPGSKDEEHLPSLQLYNLEDDIREQVNVASAYPEIVQEMKEELRAIVGQGRSTSGGPRQSNDGGWQSGRPFPGCKTNHGLLIYAILLSLMRKIKRKIPDSRTVVLFLTTLVLCFIILIMSQYWMLSTVRRDKQEQTYSMLQLIRSTTDLSLDQMFKLSQTLLLNNDIATFIYQGQIPVGSEDIQALIDAKALLPTSTNINAMLSEIYVYSDKSGYILSSRNAFLDPEKMYPTLFAFENLNYRQFKSKYLSAPFTRKFFPETTAWFMAASSQLFPWCRPFL